MQTRPRLTRYDDVLKIVSELQKAGIAGKQLYRMVTEIGPVDLDLLHEVVTRRRLVI